MTTAKRGNYTPGRCMPIQYIVLHYTAGRGDSAAGNVKYFQNNVVKASAHWFVDDKGWMSSVDESDTAWSVGTAGVYTQKHPRCFNDNSISIEMCCQSDRYTISEATVQNAIKLTRQLMQKYNIPIENVLRHWDVVNKKCPASWVDDEQKWRDFKEELDMTGEEIYKRLKDYLCSLEQTGGLAQELEQAKELGITDGTNPRMFCTRAQTAAMVRRALAKKK